MYSIEIHFGIHRIISLFHKMGIYQNNNGRISCNIGSTLYVIYSASYIISLVFGVISSDDQDDSAFIVVVILSASVNFLRLIYILSKSEEISSLVHDIGVLSFKDHEEFINTKNRLKNFERFVYCCILQVFGGFLFLPISSLLALYSENSKRILPINIEFPFNWKDSEVVYWIAFVYVQIGLLFTIIPTLLTYLIWYLMLNYCFKYRMLENKFKNWYPTTTVIETVKPSNIAIIGLVKNHRNVVKSVDQFKDCFSNLFLAQITTSGLCICGSVYVLAFSSFENMESNSYVVLLFYNIFDIFMVMYFGNEIKLSSERLPYCLFQSNWIHQSKSCKKCIIILTELLKQPQEIIIGKLYPLNLKTFTSILNFAYSMFNILQKSI